MRPPRFCSPCALAIASALALTSACDGTISVTFSTGPQEFEASTAQLDLPPEFDQGDGTVASVPCGPNGMCPPSDDVVLTCEADLCDPAPITVSAQGPVIDFDALLQDAREIGLAVVDSYEVVSVEYDVTLNTLTLPIDEVEVYWGPETATAIDPALGVRRFGTIPPIAAMEQGRGEMVVDPAGAQELSDYLVMGGARIRFFVQSRADINPGDPYPEGTLRVSVNATVRAVGGILD